MNNFSPGLTALKDLHELEKNIFGLDDKLN